MAGSSGPRGREPAPAEVALTWARAQLARDASRAQNPEGRPATKPAPARREAGRRAAATMVARYGPEHFRRLGLLGGRATREAYGSDHYRELGRKGGRGVAEQRGPEFFREIGRKSGRALVEKYGRQHLAEIARKGREAKARMLAERRARLR